MKIFFKIIGAFVFFCVSATAVTVGLISLLSGMPDTLRTAFIYVMALSLMALTYWIFFGRQQLKKRKLREKREEEAINLMAVKPTKFTEHTAAENEKPLLVAYADYGSDDVKKAAVSVASLFYRFKIEQNKYYKLTIIGLILFVIIFLTMEFCTENSATAWRAAAYVAGILLALYLLNRYVIFSVKNQLKKNPVTGEMTYLFYNNYMVIQTAGQSKNQAAKGDTILYFVGITAIYRTQELFLFKVEKNYYFLPYNSTFDAEALERFLLARFPSKYNKTYKDKTIHKQ